MNDLQIYKEIHPYIHEQISITRIFGEINQSLVSLQNYALANIMQAL